MALFHVFRWLGGLAMVYATYCFAALFLPAVRSRRLATILATVGGGLGWLAMIGLKGLWSNGLPLEFYSPETFGFLSVLGLPHLSAGRALLLSGLYFFVKGERQPERRLYHGLWGAAAWLGAGIMQPLTVVLGWLVVGMYVGIRMLVRWWEEKASPAQALRSSSGSIYLAGIMAGLSSPLVLYNLVSFRSDPFLRGWEAQNIIQSPPVGDYLLAYAWILPFAILGGYNLWKYAGDRQGQLPVVWALLIPVLVYAPLLIQRRMAEGSWVALSVCAAMGLSGTQARRPRWVLAFTGLAALSTIMVWIGATFAVVHLSLPLYRPAEEVNAFLDLAHNAPNGAIVLGSFETSNALPAWAPVRVVTGHGPESIGIEEVEPQITRFYQDGATDAWRESFLKAYGVQYVFWGPLERALGGWDPKTGAFLRMVYHSAQYDVFQVMD
ncbi:MAG: hypothetical protein GYA17_10665 [Chloroflexi bacterium]|nr:hypothetical protein [Chloroflexota bacterium]